MKKAISLILAGAMTVSSLAACSTSKPAAPATTAAPETSAPEAAEENTSSAPKQETAEKAAPLETVTMMCNYKAVEAPGADNKLLAEIAEYTGTKLEMTWVPNDAYEEKLNTLIASVSLPEIVGIREIKSSGFINATRVGMFWDLTPYISRFPNLSAINETIMTNVQTDGKQFLIPRTRDLVRAGIAIRTDWLENLGLEMPETLDEFTEILRAFTYDDPDGNGKNDTYGLSMYDQGLKNFSTQVSIYMGGPNNWYVDENDNIVSEYDTEAYTRALTWYRDCYADGLINKDFPVVTSKTQNFTDGRAGAVFIGNLEDATTTLNSLTQVNPDATADVLQILLDGEGAAPHVPGYDGYTGAIAIPTTTVKTEEHLLQILAFLDKLGDPDMVDAFNWGIEGETYTLTADGLVSQNEEQQSIYADQYNLLRQITPFYASKSLQAAQLTPLAQHVNELLGSNAKYAVFDPTLPFISETETEMGGTLGELPTFIQDSAIKYVIGDLDLAGWQDAIQTWKDMGGTEVANEFTQQYQEFH